MALFRRPLISVIEYEGPQDVFVWRHEDTNFNTKAQLIVKESQEAIFFKNGQAFGPLPAGRYTLDTQNIPFLRGIIGLATGGNTPFQCQVYFINKAVSMGISWWTSAPVSMIDPGYGVPIRVKGNGDFSLRVSDSNKLVIKLVGNVHEYTQSSITDYFSGILSAHIRDTIANTMKENQISGWDISTQLLRLGDLIREKLEPFFADYGLELVHFVVSELHVDGLEKVGGVLENNTLGTLKASGEANIHKIQYGTEADKIQTLGNATNQVTLQQGLNEALINQAKGITEAQKLAFQAANIAASNLSAANTYSAGNMGQTNFAGAGGGSPQGFRAGVAGVPPVYVTQRTSADAAAEMVKAAMGQAGDVLPSASSKPGQPSGSADQSLGTLGDGNKELRKNKLLELKELYEIGAITEEDYIEAKRKILG